jgi:hypothetical protein
LDCSGIEEEGEEVLLQHVSAQMPTAITRENCIYTTLIIAHCPYTRLESQLISYETYDGPKSYYIHTVLETELKPRNLTRMVSTG